MAPTSESRAVQSRPGDDPHEPTATILLLSLLTAPLHVCPLPTRLLAATLYTPSQPCSPIHTYLMPDRPTHATTRDRRPITGRRLREIPLGIKFATGLPAVPRRLSPRANEREMRGKREGKETQVQVHIETPKCGTRTPRMLSDSESPREGGTERLAPLNRAKRLSRTFSGWRS